MSKDEQSVLTYEKLFNILRSEKSDLKIQKLSDSYFQQIVSYLQLKTKSVQSAKSSDLFSNEQVEAEQQLRNAQRLVQDIYDRREKKVVTLALNKSRSSQSMIDTSSLLVQEQELLYDLVSVLLKYRKNILHSVLKLNFVDDSAKSNSDDLQQVTSVESNSAETDDSHQNESSDLSPQNPKVQVQILEDMDPVTGPDMQKYGPFSKDEIVALDAKLAALLVKAKKVSLVDS